MGMGEPLDNPKAVMQAVSVLQCRQGFNLGFKRIVLSTVGVLSALQTLPEKLPFQMAISLHATEDSTRNWLVPVNRRFPLADLVATMERLFPRGGC